MRARIGLHVEIIPHAVYSHPSPIHGQLCLDRRTDPIMAADDIDESFIRRLLRESLWPFVRTMGEVDTAGATSKLLQTLSRFTLAPRLFFSRGCTGTLERRRSGFLGAHKLRSCLW